MRRRHVLVAGGSALAVAAESRAQVRPRRVGVFMDVPAGDPRGQSRLAAFAQGLQEAGWSVGRNLRLEYRWRSEGSEDLHAAARVLLASAPDVILASSSPVTAALRTVGSATPIVFVTVIDPVGAGFVESFVRPGGTITGFTTIDYGIGGKWVEMLKELMPSIRSAAVLMDGALPATAGQLDAIQAAARTLSIAVTPIELRDPDELARRLAAFAATPHAGIIATASSLTGLHRDLIIRLAAAHRLPAIYPYDHFAPAGGLIAFGPDIADSFRAAAGYVDRILRGARPAELPVQAPSKVDLIINLRTAQAMGLPIPQSLLLRADEVIE